MLSSQLRMACKFLSPRFYHPRYEFDIFLFRRFLLARLHTESLIPMLNPYQVREALKTLPKTVDDTYALALARIDSQPFKSHRDFSYKILSWVAYSFRSLTISELLCALAVDPGDPSFNISKVSLQKDITSLCAGLVIIHPISEVVHLVHPTMRTYFHTDAMKGDLRFSGTLAQMTDVCITCLLFDDSDDWNGSDVDSGDGDSSEEKESDDDSLSPATPSSPRRVVNSSEAYGSDDEDVHSPISLLGSVSPSDVDPYASATGLSLEAHPDEPRNADNNLPQTAPYTCLMHDFSSDEEQPTTDDLKSSCSYLAYALRDYAVRYWGYHALHNSEQSQNFATFLCNTVRRKALIRYMWQIGMYPTTMKVTGLHIAAMFGLTAVVKALLERGYDINAQDGDGNSVLAIAIQSDNEEMAKLLADAGAFINLLEKSDQAMLVIAAEKDYKNLADRILQSAGATPQTSLLAAAYYGQDIELLQIFQHPDLDLKDRQSHFGTIALLLAVECGNYKVAEILLKHGVDANAAGGNGASSPALHRAARRGFVRIVKLLIKNNATVDLRDRDGKTAWTYSVQKKQRKISDILVKAGADPNTRGVNGLNELYRTAAGGYLDDVKFILESGTDPSIQTHFGWAPLHWAAYNGHLEVVKLLLKYGAEPSPLSDTGLTPLDKARELGAERWEIIKLLEKAGARPGRNAEGRLYQLENLRDVWLREVMTKEPVEDDTSLA